MYWTVHHLDSWIKIDQLDVTCFIISLFNAQHVSNVSTSILRSLRLICCVISWVVLLWFDVCWCWRWGSVGVVWYPYAGWSTEITQQISRKLLRMAVLTFKTCWALNNEIIKQVTSSWSIFIQQLVILVLLRGSCSPTYLVWRTPCFGLYISHHQAVHFLIIKQTTKYTMFLFCQRDFMHIYKICI